MFLFLPYVFALSKRYSLRWDKRDSLLTPFLSE